MSLPYDSPIDPGSQGYRIREERLRLKMTETEFAEAGGLGPTRNKAGTWQRVRDLETNSFSQRKPLSSVELAGMASINVDIQYILLGQRSHVLSQEEQRLVDNYRASGEEGKRSLRSVGNAFAKSRLDDDDAVVGGG